MNATPLLQMKNIHKRFGATVALRGVDLAVQAGEVHILAGENGAGKSTLMKLLTGVHQADVGEIHFRGEPFAAIHPKKALLQGIAMIYQEFNLAPHLTVHENVFLGHEIQRWWGVDAAEQRKRTRELFERFDLDIDPDVPVQSLGVSQRQMVEIARALSVDAPLIIMDEPTAALSGKETAKLFAVIRTLRNEGKGIIYISHYLEEFNEIGDHVTVLRDGEVVGCSPIDETDPQTIIRQMVGRDVDDLYPSRDRQPGDVLLNVEQLSSPNGTRHASLEVRAGEIAGIAGLVGAGRTEMLRALFGLDPSEVNALEVDRQSLPNVNPRLMKHNRVGLLSEDRAEEGLAQTLSIADNITMVIPERISNLGVISFSKQARISERLMQDVGVKAESPRQAIHQLSGGNQQKVALARLLGAEAQVLLLDEPTRGIDIGSKAEIYRMIDRLAREGKGILMVSSYLPEILGLCDSYYVMHRGALSQKYPAGSIDADQIMALATGYQSDDALTVREEVHR